MIFVQTFKSNEFVDQLKGLLREGGGLFSADRAGKLKIEVDLPGNNPAEVKLSFVTLSSENQNSNSVAHRNVMGVIAENSRTQVALGIVREVAESDDTVVIYGEHGTGKNLFARAVHNLSRRKNSPFVVLPCGSLGEGDIEEQIQEYLGAAGYGTLLLDCVHDLSSAGQDELCRKLQGEKTFRVIATTSVDLEPLIAEGVFSSSLWSLLQGGYLELPPLRERSDEIEALALFCVERYCREHNLETKQLSPELLQVLQAYRWPGNVRELVNTIEQLLITAQRRQTLFARDLPDHIRIQTIQSSSASKMGL